MPERFTAVPGWFSWQNQGAGIAVADIGGEQHLIVLMVDDGPQQNRGAYRVGRALDAGGDVTGGWSPWADVPDWFSWANQGADIAVADLGDGGQDLIVLMVDDPPGQNLGLYRIGKGLDADGAVTGGWGPWIEVPIWFSWANQGAGITVTPPDAQGRRDLVVFMIDNGAEANTGMYAVGRDVGSDGTVNGGWTPWIEVPGWFSWENSGGGVALADLDGDGTRDLLVMQIDNAAATADTDAKNEGFFLIGRNLRADGEADWETDWLGVPHWFPWANEGGGVALARLGGRMKLLVLMVDAPAEQNAGYYQVMDLDEDPALFGKWEVKTFLSGVLAVHTALLPGGKVLFFAGSGSSKVRFAADEFGDVDAGVPVSAVWTPPDDAFSHPPTLRAADGRPFDLFCGGDAFLADGRMLSAGGTRAYEPGFTGREDVAVFDPVAETWSFVASMAHGRWYPTLITLGDGRVLATTGLDDHGGDGSKAVMETYSPGDDDWTESGFAGGFAGLPLYAHLFLLQDGRVFFSGGRMDDEMDVQPCVFDVTQDPAPVLEIPDLLDPVLRNQSASVMLAPAQDQRVMICGGGPAGQEDLTHATDRVSVADLGAAGPSYTAAAPMALGRMHLNAVLLPDHTVFVSGGSLKQESEPLARVQSELYDPETDTWRLMATATIPRLYHSTAVLLADGRVVAAGGNPEGGTSVPWVPPDPAEEMQIEVFSPPYLFNGPRPVIASAPAACEHGETISITSPQAPSVKWATLVRNGVTTHAFDSGQRVVDLEILSRDASAIEARVTDNANLAPPGWYMLFLVGDEGVPSVAEWMQVG